MFSERREFYDFTTTFMKFAGKTFDLFADELETISKTLNDSEQQENVITFYSKASNVRVICGFAIGTMKIINNHHHKVGYFLSCLCCTEQNHRQQEHFCIYISL